MAEMTQAQTDQAVVQGWLDNAIAARETAIQPFYRRLLAALTESQPSRYDELLNAVASKHPGETRHQAALRYIQRAEAGDTASCGRPSVGGGE
jgi:hypothetical protein